MMAMAGTSNPDHKTPTPGGWIPWLFVGLFMVVLAVNGTMITIAVSTFNGLETTSAYEKGLAYNQRLAAAAEQERLGWQGSIETQAQDDGRVTLTFKLADRKGEPIVAADVRARLDRPLQAGHDQSVVFDEAGGGRYIATVDLPLEGQWDVELMAAVRGQRYQLTERLHLLR